MQVVKLYFFYLRNVAGPDGDWYYSAGRSQTTYVRDQQATCNYWRRDSAHHTGTTLSLHLPCRINSYKKFELMLMIRASAYSSSCSQIVLVYLHSSCRNSLFCSQKSHEITITLYFGGSRSFKVTDVDTAKKLIASACYDKQHVCAYLQPFFRRKSQ